MTESTSKVYTPSPVKHPSTQVHRVHPHPKLRSWVGGPGTGKTQHLIANFRDEVAGGEDISDIRYTTFTRAQRDDVIKRLKPDFPRKTTALKKTVRTLHGAALESVNQTAHSIRGLRIIDEAKTPGPYAAFCKEEGLPYSQARRLRDDDAELPSSVEPELGNVVIALSGYIRQHYGWTPKAWGLAANETELFQIRRHPDPETVIRRWWDWKKQNKVIEHDDYLHLAIDIRAPAPARVILIDEFQDLSPIQNTLFRMWLEDPFVERLYIAGDPNQAIYDFRGADPRFLEEAHVMARGGQIPDDRPKSHRCPRNVVNLADRVLNGHSHMEPAREGGIARWLRVRDDAELARVVETLRAQYGKVMIACRFTHYVWSISKALLDTGVPHSSLTSRLPVWADVKIPESRALRDKNGKSLKVGVPMTGVLQALRIVDRHLNGKDLGFIPIEAARSLLYLLPIPDAKVTSTLTSMKDQKMVNYTVDDLMGLLPHRPGTLEIAEHLKIPPEHRDALVRALIRGGDTLPEHIVLDTIHASKGLESPAVFVHTGFSQTRRIECARDEKKMAAERRVYYVGVTRASEATYLFDYGATTLSPAVDDIRGFGDWEAPEARVGGRRSL
mgnify:CR=1 FL=1